MAKMAKNCTVSVCIPTFNGAMYLHECLDSVLGQTFGDFELLVVDDKSSDTTFDIAHKYARRDRRVRILQNERNLGLVGNWNRCVEQAWGEWIKFLFQDDVLEPSCIEKMLNEAMQGHPLVACRRGFIFEDGATEETREHYFQDQGRLDRIYAGKTGLAPSEYANVVHDYFGWNLLGEPSAVLLNRSVFCKFGLFNPDLVQACDLEFWNRVGIHTGVKFLHDTLASFRVHGHSASVMNETKRKFRRMVVDGLILHHLEARHEAYAPFREVMARRSPPIDLEKRLRDTSFAALDKAEKYRKEGHNLENPRRILKDLSLRYIGIQPSNIEYMFWRLKRALRAAKETLARRLPSRRPRVLDG